MAYNTIKESKLIHYTKQTEREGGIVEVKIYEVPKSELYPLGLRYSLYFVKYGRVIVGYDNHYPKGPHKHLKGIEYPYDFADINKLIDDFWKDKQMYEEGVEDES